MSRSDEAGGKDGAAWEEVLASVPPAERVAGGCPCRRDSDSALYTKHRQSFDHDHVLVDLKERFDTVLAELESVAGWQTARIKRPVLILGSLDGVETGVRQLPRAKPLETAVMRVGGHAGGRS